MTASLPPPSYFSTDGKTEWALESTTLPACCSKWAAAPGTQTRWPLVTAAMTCGGGITGIQTAQEWVDWTGHNQNYHGLCLSDQGVDGFYRIVVPPPSPPPPSPPPTSPPPAICEN
eukprot:scaffold56775_cov30-Phaeocystis_antarctica.AAC.1